MANINQFSITLTTAGDKSHANTNGDAFLGICGREFFLDSPENDFEPGSTITYIFGEGTKIELSIRERNDPRNPQLTSSDLHAHPIYIRYEPEADDPGWIIADITVFIAGESYGIGSRKGLWLGQKHGKFCYLERLDERSFYLRVLNSIHSRITR